MKHRVLIIGGGAAGVFAAIRAAEQNPAADVLVLEAQSKPLGKVRISGGGRCNVTHNCRDAAQLVNFYPRGARELRSSFSRFAVQDTLNWFASRGVKIKTEDDGRMFPESNRSETIVSCLLGELREKGARLRLGAPVQNIHLAKDNTFEVVCGSETLIADSLLIATGGLRTSYKFATSLGHRMERAIPSLFSFKIDDPLLESLEGLSLPDVRAELKVGASKYKHQDPVLITHWGLSGPVVIRLSAWAAIDLFDSNYSADLFLDLAPRAERDQVFDRLEKMRLKNPKRLVRNDAQFGLPPRLWEKLLLRSQIQEKAWNEVSKKSFQILTDSLKRLHLKVSGKGAFKEEFVTAGGVNRKEIDFRTMQSKLVPNLYFAGELIDVDGITGGFNFQFAWTSGFIAGTEMSQKK